MDKRIPSLDGLRTVSIVLVLFSHLLATQGFPLGNRVEWTIGPIGYLGVRVFFVISGFLITRILMKEVAATGRVRLGRFYARRTMRLMPPLLFFITAMFVAYKLGLVHLRPRDVVHAVTYTMNYHYERSWELGHLWSLSIEEQFYLLWPLLMVLAGVKRLPQLCALMILLAPVCRVIAWFTMPYKDDVIMEAYPCVMDSIAAGCLFAAIEARLDASEGYLGFIRSRWFWLVPFAILAVNLPGKIMFDYTVDITLENVAIAVCVDRFIRVREGPAFRFLNLRPIVWFGTLSYSLYLWQEPFLNHRSTAPLTAWPVNILVAFGCAIVAFYLVERPFMRRRPPSHHA